MRPIVTGAVGDRTSHRRGGRSTSSSCLKKKKKKKKTKEAQQLLCESQNLIPYLDLLSKSPNTLLYPFQEAGKTASTPPAPEQRPLFPSIVFNQRHPRQRRPHWALHTPPSSTEAYCGLGFESTKQVNLGKTSFSVILTRTYSYCVLIVCRLKTA